MLIETNYESFIINKGLSLAFFLISFNYDYFRFQYLSDVKSSNKCKRVVVSISCEKNVLKLAESIIDFFMGLLKLCVYMQ